MLINIGRKSLKLGQEIFSSVIYLCICIFVVFCFAGVYSPHAITVERSHGHSYSYKTEVFNWGWHIVQEMCSVFFMVGRMEADVTLEKLLRVLDSDLQAAGRAVYWPWLEHLKV